MSNSWKLGYGFCNCQADRKFNASCLLMFAHSSSFIFFVCYYIPLLILIIFSPLLWLLGGTQCDTNLFPDVDSSWKVCKQCPNLSFGYFVADIRNVYNMQWLSKPNQSNQTVLVGFQSFEPKSSENLFLIYIFFCSPKIIGLIFSVFLVINLNMTQKTQPYYHFSISLIVSFSCYFLL